MAPAGIRLARVVVVTQCALIIAVAVIALLFVVGAAGDLQAALVVLILLLFVPVIVVPWMVLVAGIRLGDMDPGARVTVTVVEALVVLTGLAGFLVSAYLVGAACLLSGATALAGLYAPGSREAFAEERWTEETTWRGPAYAVPQAPMEPAAPDGDITWHQLVQYWKSLLHDRTPR